jgi:response regulator RpfG family c-di-GMP phosphodiesterase
MGGSGFPVGLSGDEIIPEGRIVMVACHFVMNLTGCCYTKQVSEKEALAEIRQGSGTLFDPAVVNACIRYLSPMVDPDFLRHLTDTLQCRCWYLRDTSFLKS